MDESGRRVTHECQGGIEVLIVLFDVVGVVIGRLPLVHCVEIETGIVGLDGLEESPKSILEAAPGQCCVQRRAIAARRTHHFGSICSGEDSFSPFSASSMSRPSGVVGW